jgi:hypothetical protein
MGLCILQWHRLKSGDDRVLQEAPRMRVMSKSEEEHDPESLKSCFPNKMVFARSLIVILCITDSPKKTFVGIRQKVDPGWFTSYACLSENKIIKN